jgi:endoglucanase
MRKLLAPFVLLATVTAAVMPSPAWAADASATDPNSFAIAQNKRLGRGVNILGYDPIWKDREKARFKEKYFRLIQEAGFNHVRINVHPLRDNALGPDNRLSAAWFETLDAALKQARANRLAVIVDFHEFRAMGDDPAGNRERMLAVWRQIAEHCRDAPDDVFFEILNEPNRKLTPDIWNPLLRAALAIIRHSNPHRTVIVGPTSSNGIKDLDKLELPEDDRNLIVTVHYYSPFPFTHQGAAFAGRKDKTGVAWNGTEAERQAIVNDFGKAQAWAERHHRPIYLGEFGAYDKAEMAARVRWASCVAREAERLGWSWAWWQFTGDFVLFDTKSDAWVEPLRRALVPGPAGTAQEAAPGLATPPRTTPLRTTPLHVGLRRSSYGLRAKNADHAWWADQAKRFAARFPGSLPTIIEIVSTYQDDDSTQFEFARPGDDRGAVTGMRFTRGRIDHEKALSEYDRQGVQAILQVEPGSADMARCLEIIHRQFGKHPCVVGLGMDAEWYFTKRSRKKEGRPITDNEAKAWLETTLTLNPNYTLFLKHFSVEHMPPAYRHPRLWFLDDSQEFHSVGECLDDFTHWGRHFPGAATGYQFGYPADAAWWSKLENPPLDLGRRIETSIPSTGYLFWVDFTANRVKF